MAERWQNVRNWGSLPPHLERYTWQRGGRMWETEVHCLHTWSCSHGREVAGCEKLRFTASTLRVVHMAERWQNVRNWGSLPPHLERYTWQRGGRMWETEVHCLHTWSCTHGREVAGCEKLRFTASTLRAVHMAERWQDVRNWGSLPPHLELYTWQRGGRMWETEVHCLHT